MSEKDAERSALGHPAEAEAPIHALEPAAGGPDAAVEDSDAYALAAEDGEGLPPRGTSPATGSADDLDVVFREPGA